MSSTSQRVFLWWQKCLLLLPRIIFHIRKYLLLLWGIIFYLRMCLLPLTRVIFHLHKCLLLLPGVIFHIRKCLLLLWWVIFHLRKWLLLHTRDFRWLVKVSSTSPTCHIWGFCTFHKVSSTSFYSNGFLSTCKSVFYFFYKANMGLLFVL